MGNMRLVRISSMEKLMPGAEPVEDILPVKAPRNGRVCFQVAYRGIEPLSFDAPLLTVSVHGKLPVKVSKVELVPCTLPAYPDADDDYLTKTPCLVPDRLVPCGRAESVRLLSDYWQTLWVEACDPNGFPPGGHTAVLRFTGADGELWGEIAVEILVEDRLLPPQRFFHTQWLHLDCICQAHRCKPFSTRFWKLAEAYLRCQVEHGINVAWTPLFTPPLDTLVGGERMTVQLVPVSKVEGGYRFDFSRMERWLSLCEGLGFRSYEFSHLFTQWGAAAAPKIQATENGRTYKAFGWHTDAAGKEYSEFLEAFLPALRQFLQGKGLWERCFFHISDEPELQHAEAYGRAKRLVCGILPDAVLRDALSEPCLYRSGLIEHPIPAIDRAAEFQREGVPDMWVYYSCVNGREYSNCFLAMPLARVRAIGKQALALGATGFLHWGFNFWNTQHSRSAIDPNVVTDAGGAFPSGDAFLVYPGQDCPLESLRLKMLALAMEDIRRETN